MLDDAATPQDTAFYANVYDLLEPFFDPANHWGGMPHEHLAFRELQQRYPDLSPRQSLALIIAAKRVFSTSGTVVPKD